jgi:uncharacterized protein YjbI with pentapeptide repeats
MRPEQLKSVIELHARYLKGQAGGRVANLQNADLAGCNLDTVDLRTMQASGVRFNDAIIRKANFSKSDLFGAHFERADMRRTNFIGADLRGVFFLETRLAGAVMEDVDLRPGAIYNSAAGAIDDASIYKDGARVANLSGADMENAQLARANMQDAVLYAANLKGADLTNVNLTNANLRNADFQGAKVQGARFAGAVMTGTNFAGVDLSVADLRGAFVQNANVETPVEPMGETVDRDSTIGRILAGHQAWIESGGRRGAPADLTGQSLANKNLRNFDFSAAKLVGTVFHQADLSGAKFEFTMMGRANLIEAKLTDAIFDGCNLTYAKLNRAVLRGASFQPKEIMTGGGESTGRFLAPDLSGADLSGADLTGVDLTQATLERILFGGAILEGTELPERYARLRDGPKGARSAGRA